jgi:hypothetical protein
MEMTMSNVSDAAVAHSDTQHNTANNVFGNAPSTISGKNTAVRVFSLYQAEAGSGDHHFDDLVPEDVENDNLAQLHSWQRKLKKVMLSFKNFLVILETK